MHVAHISHNINLGMIYYRGAPVCEKIVRKRGFKFTIIGPSNLEEIKFLNVTKGLDLYMLPHNNHMLALKGQIRHIRLLISLLKHIECDVINLHSHLFYFTAIPALIAAHKLKVPLVVTVHGVFSPVNFTIDNLQKLYLYTFCRIVWNKARLVICLTEADAREVVKYGCPRQKIVIIPNWVNTDLFKPAEYQEENLILWMGRFVSTKGLEYLVKAAKIVLQHYPKALFVLLGDGPLKSKIAHLIADEGLSKSFELRDSVSYEKVAEHICHASIFVFPSFKEGMPFAVLEAMACGIPVVGSDIPGVNSIIRDGEHGLLVEPKDHISLSKGIMRLLESKDLRTRLGKNARKLVEELYTPEQVVNKTIDLYECILKNKQLERQK